MDFDETVTVSKILTQNGVCYLLIYWLVNSFDIYLNTRGNVWRGKFCADRLKSFSKNLQLKEDVYYARVKRCLTEQREDYKYEFKNGFFYWKKKLDLSIIIEGFLPLDLEEKTTCSETNLIEVLLKINKSLKDKVTTINSKLKVIKLDYLEHLADTEEFINLKEKMENYVCQKFLNLIYLKKSKINMLEPDTHIESTGASVVSNEENFTDVK
ncbi:uncharacterized protein LOC123721882 [Papilio machaon]|uniref:uncharacterized protein LOC123721882 n=1 Tax=Papilio machaon TaxID=76193 RepID=UPI001E662FCF|nr:uncharacterized protein LOC123721882 [Papilio machaon]